MARDLDDQDRADLKRARDYISRKKYDRALPILERLLAKYKGDSQIEHYFNVATEGVEGRVVSEELHSEPQEAFEKEGLTQFYREIGINTHLPDHTEELQHFFTPLLASKAASRVSVDLAVFLASQNSWGAALSVVDRLLRADSGLRPEIRLWKMRCLLETERYSEVIATSSGNWNQNYHLPLNYLVGRAYQALGVKDQARARFEAVKRLNPDYRDVAIRLRSV